MKSSALECKAKEHLKKIKLGVDCLTLSATPIPRTLYMSLIGARDMSVINTPPQDRLPIKTVIAEFPIKRCKVPSCVNSPAMGRPLSSTIASNYLWCRIAYQKGSSSSTRD